MKQFLKRVIIYLPWMKKEFEGKFSSENVYDMLSQNNMYDAVVDYQKRVQAFRKAFSHLDSPYKSVLDIATGTGAMIEALPTKKTVSIIGIDISKGMLDVAKKRLKKFENEAKIQLLHEDFLKLHFKTNSFDLITVGFASRFVPKENENEFIRDIERWLKKDGTLVIVVMDGPEKFLTWLMKVIKFPRGSNTDMNDTNYLIKKFGTYLKYTKTVPLTRQALLFESKALYFKKVRS